ncbi:MAG: UDP-N-acetyl glucosamine 2-epimerase [Candidatus Eisenbacteria bacterium]|nr:UDP-N-acetyl glucosamine 2-epimerase [Candidatus Eisenbacteria bacterium]
MTSRDILHVVGARPNFMKAAPVIHALTALPGIRQTLVHTGQHYDDTMSTAFFQELGLPRPEVNLGIGSGTHAVQTAQIMMRFEEHVLAHRPDLVMVYGDVNSTVAAALVCAKQLIPVAHVEAGLRSFDRTMPEEINRLLTDQIADLLFAPSMDGRENLLREGVAPEKIHLVGNVMIDTLVRLLPKAQARWREGRGEKEEIGGEDSLGVSETRSGEAGAQRTMGLATQRSPREAEAVPYCLVTLHRPSNVDDPARLASMMNTLAAIGHGMPVIFPIHPRTMATLGRLDDTRFVVHRSPGSSPCTPSLLDAPLAAVSLFPPLPYLDFLALQMHATVVITDSGGVQEETTYLGVPCLTVRETTERPITVTMGTNTLVGSDMHRLQAEVGRILEGRGKTGLIPPLWDGHAGERIASIVAG